MSFTIKESPGPLSEDELKKLESKTSALPKDYRQFLLKYNGGDISPDCFNSAEGESISSVRSFLGITDDSILSLYHYLETYENRLPKRFLPIAFDSFGNLICLSLFGADRGAVYFWDHELEADEEDNESPETAENITLLSPSFSGFLQSLYEFKKPDNFDELLKGARIIK